MSKMNILTEITVKDNCQKTSGSVMSNVDVKLVNVGKYQGMHPSNGVRTHMWQIDCSNPLASPQGYHTRQPDGQMTPKFLTDLMMSKLKSLEILAVSEFRKIM